MSYKYQAAYRDVKKHKRIKDQILLTHRDINTYQHIFINTTDDT